MSGAIDVFACMSRNRAGNYQCTPKCAVCGHGPHAAVHGPKDGNPPGSEPWGHVYRHLHIEEPSDDR